MLDLSKFIASIQDYFLLSSVAAALLTALISAFFGAVSLKQASITLSEKRILAKVEAVDAGRTNDSSTALQRIDEERKPFETTALAKYYNQALLSATVSFWFSLIFASIGFVAILFAFATYTKDDPAGTFIKFLGGGIIDAVSALFFVQSNRARKSMSEFFEKLRLDRLNAEARDMIDDIADQERKDQLRMQLILKYSEINTLVVGG